MKTADHMTPPPRDRTAEQNAAAETADSHADRRPTGDEADRAIVATSTEGTKKANSAEEGFGMESHALELDSFGVDWV